MRRYFREGANILDVSEYLKAQIFYMEANILGMRRFFKMCAYILIGSEYFDMRRYFEMCAYIFFLEANVLCVK